MNGWHAVVPIKPIADRKMRLRGCLTDTEVEDLTERMLHHVMVVLRSISGIGKVSLLAGQPHPDWPIDWFPDRGVGLTVALQDVTKEVPRRLLVVHADLPVCDKADIEALIAGSAIGAAIAPDRHGTGTNALALTEATGFPFAFGPDSFARHRELLPHAAIIVRRGLALDVDLPADLALLSPQMSVTS